MKKLVSLILAIMMIAAVGAAGAANMGANGRVESTDTTINLKKGIVLYNTEGSTIYYPTITYNYSIAPATVTSGTTSVTDDNGNTAMVLDGVTDGVSLTDSQAVFANTSISGAATTGTEVYDTITASVDLTKFSRAGIYRYVITEEDNTAEMTTAGLTRPTGYVSTRYLDVYIRNASSGVLEAYGYVCFIATSASTETIDGKTSTNNQINAKTEGFVETKDTDASTSGTTNVTGNADKYYTYNVSVTKVTTGGLADKTWDFNFQINTSGVTSQPFSVTTTGINLSGTTEGAVTGSKKHVVGTALTVELEDTKQVKLFGLPANTSITQVQETNDSVDTYKVKIDLDSNNVVTEASKAPNATTDISTAQVVTNYSACSDQTITQRATAYTVTNTLLEVSPTGYVTRFAPYALILIGGIALLIIAKKRKPAKDDEE